MSTPSAVPDAELVRQMASGDRVALAELYERHAPRLLALSRALLRERKEAEDLVHDVFLEAWRRSADYSTDRGTVQTWLLMRTRSRALDRLKAAGRRREVQVEDWQDEVSAPAATHDQTRVRELVARMPQPQQEVILLGYFEGLSTTEIAERLSIPTGTVKSRTRAALTTLRGTLQGSADE